jgi:hypothetical protein
MTTFETISIIIAILLILGSIISVYVTCRIKIAKIEVEIASIRRDLIQKEIALCLIEKNNREDHRDIIFKVDKILESVNSK